MTRKVWYEIWGAGPMENRPSLIAKVKSEGLARLVVAGLKTHYKEVEVK